jgi:hypothetical protein
MTQVHAAHASSRPALKHLAAAHHPVSHGRKATTGHGTRDTFHAGGARHVTPVTSGSVSGWINQAQTVLRAAGVPDSKMNTADLAIIINHESSGNPNCVNTWDSNARAGHPSIGLMQTTGPTFATYKLPGHNDIRNPVDNIVAGVRYAIDRYGSVSNVPGVRHVHQGRTYVGY